MQWTFSRIVNADPSLTFEVFTDLRHAADNVSGIKRLEVEGDDPVSKGTRFRETRVMFGKEHTEEMEITEFEPGRSYTISCRSCGSVWSSKFTLEPHEDGTRVEVQMTMRPVSIGAKIMSPLGWAFSGGVKKCVESDLTDLKAVAEGRHEPAEPVATA